MIEKIKSLYKEYPKPFWIMMLGLFIDQLGGNIMYPFFTLYITLKFGVGLTQVGLLLGAMTAGGIIGGLIGGSLADRFGRKKLLLFGLLTSGLYNVVIIFIKDFSWLFGVAVTVGFLGSMSGPASQAMLADLLPEEKRASGFGVLRVVFNLTVAIGPLIGGFISDYSYYWLFIIDAITSSITFLVVVKMLPETAPKKPTKEEKGKKFSGVGYKAVFRDKEFLILIGIFMLTFAIMMQMLSTLSVFMRDVQGFPNKYYGYILSLNAVIVVALQFWVSRKSEKIPPLFAMVIGSIFATVGYTLFGFVNSIWFFALAMVILTIGEMIMAPIGQTLAAKFAPLDMRARYMAVFGFSSRLSNLATPYLAGLVIDNYDPRWIWYTCGIVGTVTIFGYLVMHLRTRDQLEKEPAAT